MTHGGYRTRGSHTTRAVNAALNASGLHKPPEAIFCLDIGPKADGTIPRRGGEGAQGPRPLTKKHAEAIYDTFARRHSGSRTCTRAYTSLNQAGDILYLYLP